MAISQRDYTHMYFVILFSSSLKLLYQVRPESIVLLTLQNEAQNQASSVNLRPPPHNAESHKNQL